MKKNKVFTGNFIEILENSELRNVVGGYDRAYKGPGGAECCQCAWIFFTEQGVHSGEGGVCGSSSDSNCEGGVGELRSNILSIWGDIFIAWGSITCGP
jgi:hypothetical protein